MHFNRQNLVDTRIAPQGAPERTRVRDKLREVRDDVDAEFSRFKMAHSEGFEPPTNWFEASYSIQLS